MDACNPAVAPACKDDLLSRHRALYREGILEELMEYVGWNVETYHRQFCPPYRNSGIFQDNK
jgi:hypothetical protein